MLCELAQDNPLRVRGYGDTVILCSSYASLRLVMHIFVVLESHYINHIVKMDSMVRIFSLSFNSIIQKHLIQFCIINLTKIEKFNLYQSPEVKLANTWSPVITVLASTTVDLYNTHYIFLHYFNLDSSKVVQLFQFQFKIF